MTHTNTEVAAVDALLPKCRTFNEDGSGPICDAPGRYLVWGHLFTKMNKGPKCYRHLPPECKQFRPGVAAGAVLDLRQFALQMLAARPGVEPAGTCPECGDRRGWRIEPDPATGDAMQVQCRTCAERPETAPGQRLNFADWCVCGHNRSEHLPTGECNPCGASDIGDDAAPNCDRFESIVRTNPTEEQVRRVAALMRATSDLNFDPSVGDGVWICGDHGVPECTDERCRALPWPEPNGDPILDAFTEWARDEFRREVKPYDDGVVDEMPDEAFRSYSLSEWPVGEFVTAITGDDVHECYIEADDRDRLTGACMTCGATFVRETTAHGWNRAERAHTEPPEAAELATESIVCTDYPNCPREHGGGAGGVPVHPPKGSRISGDEPLIPDAKPARANPTRGEINRVAAAMKAAWDKAEPQHPVALYPASYMATFADMARAAIASLPVERCAPSEEEIARILRDEAHSYVPSFSRVASRVAASYNNQPTVEQVVEQYRTADGFSPALRDIALERATHEQRGWTAEHDARQGYGRLLKLSDDYQLRYRADVVNHRPADRGDLVKAASLLLAAIELLDRSESDHVIQLKGAQQ